MPESLFNKVAGLGPRSCDSIKKEALAQVFSCKFYEIFKNTFFTEHLWMTASAQNTCFKKCSYMIVKK